MVKELDDEPTESLVVGVVKGFFGCAISITGASPPTQGICIGYKKKLRCVKLRSSSQNLMVRNIGPLRYKGDSTTGSTCRGLKMNCL